MIMNVTTLGWVGLGLVLFFSTVGTNIGVWLLIYIFSFLGGALLRLLHCGKKKSVEWRLEHAHMQMPPPQIGIPKIVSDIKRGRGKFKFDKRMTGSSTIDEVLQELLDFTYRDYIQSWYKKISDDEQFGYDIRITLQRVIIALSERAKDVDLVPYLTTRLVDDFASHLKLYRRALTRVKDHQKDDTKPPVDLESVFFDLEFEMEKDRCRDMICMSEDCERQYLQDLSEVLLFLLLPPEDFHNKPFRYIVREVLVNGVFLPAINLVSDPDYVNQMVAWVCKDTLFTSESFITIIKTSDSTEELQAVKEMVEVDIARQRSKDTGGDDDTQIKQQLNSLLFVKNMCETRIKRLNEGLDESDFVLVGGYDLSKLIVPGQKLYSLPFDVVLNNNVALSYFIEFMSSIGAQSYLFFYLHVEGYRVSAEQQVSASFLAGTEIDKTDLERLRDAALSIYDQYLSEKAIPRIKVEESLLKSLWETLQYGQPRGTVFDEVQLRVWELFQEDPRYFPAFKNSQLYIKLLAELDLLKDGERLDDNMSREEDGASSLSSRESSPHASVDNLSSTGSLYSTDGGSPAHKDSQFTLSAHITNTGICKEHGKPFAIYMITVTKHNPDGTEEVWDVYRRYSDFYDLHAILQDKFEPLSSLALPSKKAFQNMNKEFLEKRKVGLNAYLQTLLNPSLLKSHRGLLELVHQFLEHIIWEREKNQLLKTVNTAVVNPLKTSVRNVGNFVRSMPDNFVDGVAKMSGGIKSIPNNMLDGVGKILNVKASTSSIDPLKGDLIDSSKVGASLDTEDEDNIPLRIMLLLMDEVFDLKSRNQWLRRRIVAILRQIIKTMFGDSINRRIVEHVEWMTSADQIAEYLKSMRDSFWPGGTLAEPRIARDHNTKMRTRVVTKAKMYTSISDELRHMIGTETTRHGVMRVFNMFQHQRLNRRLVYVILEGILKTLFPDNKFEEVFKKVYARSPRAQKE